MVMEHRNSTSTLLLSTPDAIQHHYTLFNANAVLNDLSPPLGQPQQHRSGDARRLYSRLEMRRRKQTDLTHSRETRLETLARNTLPRSVLKEALPCPSSTKWKRAQELEPQQKGGMVIAPCCFDNVAMDRSILAVCKMPCTLYRQDMHRYLLAL